MKKTLLALLIVCSITLLPSTAFAQVSAHRGDSEVTPENTVPSFVLAVAKGAQQIELDVNLSSDGHLVVMHDPTIDRTTNGTGNVTDHTLKELKALDAGTWKDPKFAGFKIPTLREALSAIPKNVLCNVHLKNDKEVAIKSAQLIKEMGRLDQCFLATTLENIAAAREVVPEIKVCNMTRQAGDRARYIKETIENKCDFIQLHQQDGYENIVEEVKQLKENGVTVNWFGANDAPLITLLHEAGVDYILTDKLDLALATIGNKSE